MLQGNSASRTGAAPTTPQCVVRISSQSSHLFCQQCFFTADNFSCCESGYVHNKFPVRFLLLIYPSWLIELTALLMDVVPTASSACGVGEPPSCLLALTVAPRPLKQARRNRRRRAHRRLRFTIHLPVAPRNQLGSPMRSILPRPLFGPQARSALQ